MSCTISYENMGFFCLYRKNEVSNYRGTELEKSIENMRGKRNENETITQLLLSVTASLMAQSGKVMHIIAEACRTDVHSDESL